MKKLFLALMLMLPLMAVAKGPVDTKYLRGAVPEENGVIVSVSHSVFPVCLRRRFTLL